MEELIPLFGNHTGKAMVNALTGGCYQNQIMKKGRLLLLLDIPLGQFELLDISLFYNYKTVRFLFSFVQLEYKIKILYKEDTKGPSPFCLYIDLKARKVYIEFIEGDTSLHIYNLRFLLSQQRFIEGQIIESLDDVTGFQKIEI